VNAIFEPKLNLDFDKPGFRTGWETDDSSGAPGPPRSHNDFQSRSTIPGTESRSPSSD